MDRRLRGAAWVAIALGLVACGARPLLPERHRYKYGADEMNSVVLPPLELRYDGLQRFEYCPPRGDVHQPWIPPIPAWHPRSVDAPTTAPEGAVSGELTSYARDATQTAFRHCRGMGLGAGPSGDARVAVVLRVDGEGRVADVETWGACGMTYDALSCLRAEAFKEHLPPPAEGSATVVVPNVYFGTQPTGQGLDDSYAAGAAVAIEGMRPRLYACMDTARREGKGIAAQGRFTINIDRKGKAARVNVDLWRGAPGLLTCAGEAVNDAPYPVPPIGWGKVVVTIVFEPGTGTL
jgi:hypothetical protein